MHLIRSVLIKTITFIFTLVCLSIIVFVLIKQIPGDPVLKYLGADQSESNSHSAGVSNDEYYRTLKKLGLDKPVFYFSLGPKTPPNVDIERINPLYGTQYQKLLASSANKPETDAYYHTTDELTRYIKSINDSLSATKSVLLSSVYNSFKIDNFEELQNHWKQMALSAQVAETSSDDQKYYRDCTTLLLKHLDVLKKSKQGFTGFIPAIKWHGSNNQYHKWMADMLKGEFGTSIVDGRNVTTKIKEALSWTIGLNLLTLILAFGISIPLSMFMVRKKGSGTVSFIKVVLDILYASPVFWTGSLFISFAFLKSIFVVSPVKAMTLETGSFQSLFFQFTMLLAPAFILALPDIAYLTRLLTTSIETESGKFYATVLKAKGLPESYRLNRHLLINAIFPVISLVGNIIPGIVAGSIIAEVLFSIPGIGRLLYFSIFARDWQITGTLTLLTGALAIAGFMLSDLLYKLADPRIKHQKTVSE